MEDNSFDVVLCTEVLEHVPEPIAVVHELGRILKPGGKLILTAPLGSGLHQEPYHFYGGYTPHWYQKFLTESGFEDITIVPNAGTLRHIGQETIRFVRLTMNLWWFWPVGLMLWPFLMMVPLVARALDSYCGDEFTVGYHVTAVKCR